MTGQLKTVTIIFFVVLCEKDIEMLHERRRNTFIITLIDMPSLPNIAHLQLQHSQILGND